MTLQELAQKLNTLGYPVAYSHFKTAQTPPFICYLSPDVDSYDADDETYHEFLNVDIELYVKKKTPTIEKQIKDLLKENKLPYSYVENYIKDEGVFQCTFSIQLF